MTKPVKKISFVGGRGPYVYARFTAGKAEYEFEWDKSYWGQEIIQQSRKWLKKNGDKDKDIRLLSLDREVKGKIVEVDDDAGPRGPYWFLLFAVDPDLIEFVMGTNVPAEFAILECTLELKAHGAPPRNINLLRVRKKKQ